MHAYDPIAMTRGEPAMKPYGSSTTIARSAGCSRRRSRARAFRSRRSPRRTRCCRRCATSQPQVLVSDIRMPGESGLVLLNKVKERYPQHPGHHHDRVLGSRQRGRGVPGRRVRIPAEAVRRRSCGRADPPRGAEMPGDDGAAERRRRGAGDARPGAGDAGSVSRDRPPVAVECDGADHRRIGHRQGARRARAASAQSARRGAVRRDQHRGDPEGPARVRAVRPRARRVHRRAERCAAAASSRPKAARCSSTRSATCRPTCRCACCACSPTASTTASAAMRR